LRGGSEVALPAMADFVIYALLIAAFVVVFVLVVRG
jgi:hypothetical protein